MKTLVTDNWCGVHANHRTITDPTWSHVEMSIRALNEFQHTEVSIEQDDGWSMFVAGGNGRFSMFVQLMTVDDERHYTLYDPERPEEPHQELVRGGQPGLPPANEVFDETVTLRAAKTFFETGRPDPGLTWRVVILADSTGQHDD